VIRSRLLLQGARRTKTPHHLQHGHAMERVRLLSGKTKTKVVNEGGQ
jgi:hypothetical protein